MNKKHNLIELINIEFDRFKSLNYSNSIVPNSIPILWFGNFEKYLISDKKIITVSLNPSDNEFKLRKMDPYSTKYRFSPYNGTVNSLYDAYNEYFSLSKSPYNSWFKSSFKSVLESFNASHYNNAPNIALHTDIGSPYATSPTWSGLGLADKKALEPLGSLSWHSLVKILEPDIILFSASYSFEKKIKFKQIGNWKEIDVNADRPLLVGKFQINETNNTTVLFQVQGRKPFLKSSKEEKLNFRNHI